MLKIIVDTNVLVSALIGTGFPKTIVFDVVLGKKAITCVSNAIMTEYIDVLNRPKFTRYSQFITKSEIVINKIEELSKVYIPEAEFSIIKDTSDNKFVELAFVSNADYLITGNTNDFTLKAFGVTQIVTPEEFFQKNPALNLFQ